MSILQSKGTRGSGIWNLQSVPIDSSSSATSARVGFCPQALKRSPRLVLGTRPFPLLSNKAKASRYWSVDEGYKNMRLAYPQYQQSKNQPVEDAHRSARFEGITMKTCGGRLLQVELVCRGTNLLQIGRRLSKHAKLRFPVR